MIFTTTSSEAWMAGTSPAMTALLLPVISHHHIYILVRDARKSYCRRRESVEPIHDRIAVLEHHSGMLSCFFGGFDSCLPRNMASARHSRRRVPRGKITSSIKPRLAATKGLANFS